jgi:uncharacterized protein with HEPN domain
MSQHDDGVRLRHMLDAAKQAVEFTSGRSNADIAGTRDRLVHAYFDVDLERLWQIVAVDLPPLVASLEGALPTEH